MESGDRLFRRESGRMVAALTRIFGVGNVSVAEDVVQDAFCRALEVWKYRGVPENPSAWLMATAKHRALDVLRRERTARIYAPELARLLASGHGLEEGLDQLFAAHEIKDDRLRMMFSCCQPALPPLAQIALILKLLCGFTSAEIAAAFFTSTAAMEKRVARAKRAIAQSGDLFAFEEERTIAQRLSAVQRALYLLFSEGYHGGGAELAVRTGLCREAMRLAAILVETPVTTTPSSRALYALMCLHAARLPARVDASGNLTSLVDQDRSRFDRALVATGEHQLEHSATGSELSEYHVEAAIAWAHVRAPSSERTDWPAIVDLYDLLLTLRPSPVVALNRAIALAQFDAKRARKDMESLPGRERLADYPFYLAALGELDVRSGDLESAAVHFEAALKAARNPMERQFFAKRIAVCREA